MTTLTPTEQATLDALHAGPATAAELRDRTGRSRSATDKALANLAKVGLTTRATDGPDGPTRWTLTTATDAPPNPDEPIASEEIDIPEDDGDLGQTSTPDVEFGSESDRTRTDTGDHGDGENHGDDACDDLQDADDQSDHEPVPTEEGADDPDAADSPDPDPLINDGTPANDEESGAPGSVPDEPEPELAAEVKVCRGCQEQMPAICPCCWQKTTAYCGTCRKNLPTNRRTPGEPQILPNGLRKLTRGELERLVNDVMRAQPMPGHLGITGWTPGRIAIFLPGRSTGAIGNALDKLTTTGHAALIGETPKRYQPIPHPDDELTDDLRDHD